MATDLGKETLVSDLTKAGLAKNPRELLHRYLEKVGDKFRREVMKDRRVWSPDGRGEQRQARRWEEAHKVVLELESTLSSARALNSYT